MENNNDIDFVITWVDSNDPAWRKEKARYSGLADNSFESVYNQNDVRYRDWGLLRYWFRAVEQYAPWVRCIHFVTWGHIPAWLNTENPKIHVVKHTDYIDAEYLPTFSSRPIELNMHRIPGLSEKFVYFNDDMYLNSPVSQRDFFHNNLPCDSAILDTILARKSGIANSIVNSLKVINEYFSVRETIKQKPNNWLNLKYGKDVIKTLLLLPWGYFTGFVETHTANAFLKSTFQEVWEKEEKYMREVSSSKFRDEKGTSQWLMRYWQLASNTFYPRTLRFQAYFGPSEMHKAAIEISREKYKLLCINDSEQIRDYDMVRRELIDAFERKYPHKSTFEL